MLASVLACDDEPVAPRHAAEDSVPAVQQSRVEQAPPVLGRTDRTAAWLEHEAEGTRRPAYLSSGIDAAAAHARMLQLMADAHEGGSSGFYLKEIGGSVHLAEKATQAFEPASSIKALIHFHAMRQVQDGAVIGGDAVTLDLQIPWFMGPANYSNSPEEGETSCPGITDLASDELANGLMAMMVPSDNRWTQAMRNFFGDGNIDDTRVSLGMTQTELNHLIGCAGPALADPNKLTLFDAGKMYEAVATEFLDEPTRTDAFDLMVQDDNLFSAIIDEEAAGLGLLNSSIVGSKLGQRSALKAGSYKLDSKLYRAVAGWGTILYKNATCNQSPRQYVYGAFIHNADELPGAGIRTLGTETFREHIRDGLESWAACEADLSVQVPQVIDLDDPLLVNSQVGFTVLQTVHNDGPAPEVDAVLTTSITAPQDCTVSPAEDTRAVTGLADGETREVDIAVTLECAAPSEHVLNVTAAIGPQIAALIDPVGSNDDAAGSESRELIAYADLAVDAWDFSELDGAKLGDLLLGEVFSFVTTKTVSNGGDTQEHLYHDPAAVQVSRTMAVPDGIRGSVRIGADETAAEVVIEREGKADEVIAGLLPGELVEADGPATITVTFQVLDLAVDAPRDVAEEFGIECLAPGDHALAFANRIEAVDPHLLDPDADNDELEVERVIECVVPVQLNIRPGNESNQVNPGSSETLRVAILTTEQGEYGLPEAFDAATVQPNDARFGTAETLNGGNGSIVMHSWIRDSFEMDDKTRDGDLDLVLMFPVVGTGIEPASIELCVVGQFLGADAAWYTFFGCDAVNTQGS